MPVSIKYISLNDLVSGNYCPITGSLTDAAKKMPRDGVSNRDYQKKYYKMNKDKIESKRRKKLYNLKS
jgi:hypothetical protein